VTSPFRKRGERITSRSYEKSRCPAYHGVAGDAAVTDSHRPSPTLAQPRQPQHQDLEHLSDYIDDASDHDDNQPDSDQPDSDQPDSDQPDNDDNHRLGWLL
jgi:hypothetical protein